jgi:hypothetical protein
MNKGAWIRFLPVFAMLLGFQRIEDHFNPSPGWRPVPSLLLVEAESDEIDRIQSAFKDEAAAGLLL